MTLLRYMKPIDSLPDPRGSLSHSIPSQAIAEANREVQKAMAGGGKCGLYTKYSATVHAEIGKYTYQHGAAAAARHFTRKLEKPVHKSTVKLIRRGYIEELQKREHGRTMEKS